jgi:cytochrome c
MNVGIAALGVAGMLMMGSSSANAALDDAKAQELMKTAGCIACHSVDKKLVGPSYKDVALKRKATPDAAAMLEKKVREGGKGEYGAIPMPPNPAAKISDADLHELVQWVLTK